MRTSDEPQVIREVLGGDTGAFRLLVERYERPVYRFVHGFVTDAHECEDIAQDVFLAAYDSLASFDPSRASFVTWLFAIARNQCLNWLKRKRNQNQKQERTASEQLAMECVCSHTPLVDAAEKEFFEQLDRALSELPLGQRMAFVLYEIEGLSYEQIAQIERTRLGTVKSRIARAKKTLRSLLAPITREP